MKMSNCSGVSTPLSPIVDTPHDATNTVVGGSPDYSSPNYWVFLVILIIVIIAVALVSWMIFRK